MAIPDSIDVKNAIEELAEVIATTPPNELLTNLLEQAIDFGIKVVAALLIYALGAWLIKFVKRILARYFTRRKTEQAVASFIGSLVSIGLTILLIVVSIGVLGVNTTSFAALLAAGGMAVGMALSGTVQNFAGGIMLLIFKPFKSGDFIEAQGYSGTVTEVTIFSTKLATTDNKVIIIPNGILSNETINNYSERSMRRLEWLVDVEYGSSSSEVKRLLQSIIDGESRILYITTGAPADPMIELGALKDSSVQFVMRAWVKSDDYWPVFYAINERIYNDLPANGILFPYPQLEVHLNK